MKKVFRIIPAFVFLAVFFFCLIALAKPGAAFFYKDFQVEMQNLSRDGNAFRYSINYNNQFYELDTLLTLEDEKVLGAVNPEYAMSAGEGVYSFERSGENQVTVLFAPSDPATNDHNYHISIRPYFVTSHWVLICFLLCALGIVSFLISSITSPEKRKILLASPFGIIKLWDEGIDQLFNDKSRASVWKKAFINLVLISFLYVLMEWVFFVTKPSFMDMLNWGEKIRIVLITAMAMTLLVLLSLLLLFLVELVLFSLFSSYRKYIYHIPTAFIATCLGFILLDNFTYTVFKFGIVGSNTYARIFYLLAFVGVFISILWKIVRKARGNETPAPNHVKSTGAIVLFGLSFVIAVFRFHPGYRPDTQVEQSFIATRPNIILLSNDGLNAENMSVYGYERDTTPFMKEIAGSSLIGLNNFPNSGSSTGSEVAMLTGKLPFATRVLYPPDTLKGEDMYQHLPGLLQRIGYRTISLGVPHFVDVNTLNFQNAFDVVNGEENVDEVTSLASKYGYSEEIYFFNTIWGRIRDRLQHIFFIEDKENLITYVTGSSNVRSDAEQMESLYADLDETIQTGQPLFAHLHLMGTHGGMFNPSVQVFSKGEEQSEPWMTDFYDDAILNYDMEVEKLVRYLKEQGIYDNTILVLYTDHGHRWTTTDRVPLIIHLPNNENVKAITENTQNMDIAATLLDYMEIEQPDWMGGISLLGTIDPARLILAARVPSEVVGEDASGQLAILEEKISPPFYQFGHLTVVQCQSWYDIDLDELIMTNGEVENYVDPCSPDMLDSPEWVWQEVGKMLMQLGYQLPEDWQDR